MLAGAVERGIIITFTANKIIMNKRFLLGLLGILGMQSCVTFYFAQPLPSDAKTARYMPRSIRGQWSGSEGTLNIDKTRWVSVSNDSTGRITMKVEYRLCDSLIVKQYRGYYFFNTHNRNGHWNVYAGNKKNRKFIITQLARADSLLFQKTLGMVPDSTHENSLFFTQPIGKRELVRYIKRGGFTDTLLFSTSRAGRLAIGNPIKPLLHTSIKRCS